VLDSESTDGTPELTRAVGFVVQSIRREEFNHGGTRQFGTEILQDAKFLICLTQDAVLTAPDALVNLVRPFDDPQVRGCLRPSVAQTWCWGD
jgi:rhamnosyltransferase